MTAPIPLTVIGGYLGAGKTTLINHLLRHADGRRIAVIVNDFGSLAIDADLLADADAGDDVIALANGCVCCTVGAGLHEVLSSLIARPEPPEHVVIEVSGVADPTAAAAWGTVPPFEPGGVIVLADATQIIRMSRDRYVGTEIRRQLAGADLIAVTKTDRRDSAGVQALEAWLDDASGGVPRVKIVNGEIPPDIVLGIRAASVANSAVGDDRSGEIQAAGEQVEAENGRGRGDDDPRDIGERRAGEKRAAGEQDEVGSGSAGQADDGARHGDRYVTWSWTSTDPTSIERVEALVSSLPTDVLRLKGCVRLIDGTGVVVQGVGRHVEVTPTTEPLAESRLVAIGLRGDPPLPSPFATYLE